MNNEEWKKKLRHVDDDARYLSGCAEADTGNYGCGWSGGYGTGPDDCMLPEIFEKLSDLGVINSEVYVCGRGWTAPQTVIVASGSGSGFSGFSGCGDDYAHGPNPDLGSGENYGCGSNTSNGCGESDSSSGLEFCDGFYEVPESGDNGSYDTEGHNRNKLSELSQKAVDEVTLFNMGSPVYVTSVSRSPRRQAEIMYQNLKGGKKMDAQKRLYGQYGDMVLNVFDEHKSKEENIRAMEAKIEEVGPFKVSHHCGRSDSLEVFDVSITSIKNLDHFISGLRSKGYKVLLEHMNGCVHVEIPRK